MVSAVCQEIIQNGVCQTRGCTAKHDVHVCSLCRIVCETQSELRVHFTGKKHRHFVAGTSGPAWCRICSTELFSAHEFLYHKNSARHRRKMRHSKVRGNTLVQVRAQDETVFCETCAVEVLVEFWNSHLSSRRHRTGQNYSTLKGALDEAEKNKNGIVVAFEDGLDFEIVEPEVKYSLSVTVENASTTTMKLTSASMTSSHQHNRLTIPSQFSFNEDYRNIALPAGRSVEIDVKFSPGKSRGRFEDRLELYFSDLTLNEGFAITRPIRAIVGSREDYELLRARAPYVRSSAKHEHTIAEFLPGVPPPALAEVKWTVRLEKYEMPAGLKEVAFGKGSNSEIAKRVRNAWLPKTFEGKTYGRQLSILLWIEEERAMRDLQQYDMENVTLEPTLPYYRLEVEGLAEKRPSVVVSDRIFVKHYNSQRDYWFEGCVHRVKEKSVDLRFNGSFNSYKGQKYYVRFDLNRLVYRRMHQALNTAFNPPRVLFPAREHIGLLKVPTSRQIESIQFVDRKIGGNPPQRLAIAAILYRTPGSVPFVLFGPPGTGKTVTIIEAIRQILLKDRNARILACAPSNSASDTFCERLSINGLGKTELFRLNAPTRDAKHVTDTIIKHSLKNSEGRFMLPTVAALRAYRVVVSTCFSASTPYGIGVPRGHFTHIFIDEAGQASEPEVMIPIKAMADTQTTIILSGDNKQLGPIVRSPVARELGLAKSYLDRLMSNTLYDEVTGNGLMVVKLTKNWRSHESILKFPNDEFYKSELEACGDIAITHSALRWDMLPKADFPIIFHGIQGKDEREASSPSFFNISEASEVKRYVQNLFGDRRLRLTAQHIGIISPYYAQIQKIRQLLSSSTRGQPSEAKNIKVGSVEEFQGQERRIIIISTVRSSMDFISFDLRHTLGFVANPRRFNVAITRAQALLIVIGDPAVLSLDPLWKSFINYVHVNGGYTGKRIDWDPSETVDRSVAVDNARRVSGRTEREQLIARILGQSEDLAERDEDEELEGNIDRPWREDQ